MRCLVTEGVYNFGESEADVLLAADEKDKAIESEKDFVQGMIIILVYQAIRREFPLLCINQNQEYYAFFSDG